MLRRFYYTSRNDTKEKRRSHSAAALKLSILPEQEFYDDLYLTEQPYGFVSGVLTDLPDND